MRYPIIRILPILLLFMFFIANCADSNEKEKVGSESNSIEQKADPNDWRTNKGIGPITNVILADEIDLDLVAKGEVVFTNKCTACHKVEKRYIGPSPQGILDRRTPEWVMNIILNPDVMVKEDPIAKQLLMEYNGTPMANQNLTEEEARSILEYFRTL